MKRFNFLKKLANTPPCGFRGASRVLGLVLVLLTIGVGQMWGADTQVYKLSITKNTSNSNYAQTYDITVSSIGWKVPGNMSAGNYIKIGGGKTTALSNANRTLYSKTAISDNVSKVVVNHGTKDAYITINSMTLTVHSTAASAANGSSPVSTVTGTFAASGDVTFDRPNNADWSGKFYRLNYNVSTTGTSNVGFIFNSMTFYKTSCASWSNPTVTYSATTLTAGGAHATVSSISGTTYGTVSYASSNTSVLTVNASTGEVTPVASGTAKVTVSWAGNATYCAKDLEVNFTVNTPTYTVSFNTGTGNTPQANITEASGGAGITLPAGPEPACSDDGWVFIGWKETSAQASSTTAPDMLAAGMTYKPTSNCTLYAVYYKPADSNPNNYTKVTSNSNNLTSGQYVIYANGEAMNNVITSSKIAGKSVSEASSGVISTTDADIIWTLYKNGTNYQLYNAGVSKYLEVTGQNSLSLPTSSKGFTLYAFNTTTGQVSLKSVNQTSYQFQYYNGNFSSYGSQSVAIYFYKRGGTYNSNPTCCAKLDPINGSVSWTNSTTAVVEWDKLDDKVSAWALSWSPNTDGSSITSAIADKGTTQKTATVSGLACGTEYTFTFTPTLKLGVCALDANPTKVSTSPKYTVTLAGSGSVTGGTFKVNNVTAATTTVCSGSVDIVATAGTGYDFGSWSIYETATPANTISPAENKASTSFTMPAKAVTVGATFTPQQYSITYKDQGDSNFSGTQTDAPATHTYGTVTTLKIPTKTGYDFGGWFTASNCASGAVGNTTAASLSADGYTANITLYAKWTAKTTNLVLNKNNSDESGTANGSGSVAYDGESATITTAATRTGYHLDGGYYTNGGSPLKVLNENGSFAVDANGDVAGYVDDNKWNNTNSEVTLYAHWAANTFTVVFHKNNDDAEGTMSNQSFTYDVYKELTSNGFTLENYTFQGWATEENGDVVHENEAEVGNLTATNGGTIDLYAVWVANSHTVTYVANDKTDGTVPTDANSPYNHNAQVTVLGGGTLEKEHYAFVGWTDGVTNYVAGNKFTITDDVTLSARWTCDEKVTVSEGTPTNGSFTLDNSGVLATCDAAVVVTVSPSANPGYEFDAITQTGLNSGVTINQNAKTVTYDLNTSGSSEINVTFAAKHITVTWNVNGGDELAQGTSEYVYDGSTVGLPTPTKTGYDFDGWYAETSGGTKITEIGTTNKPSANVTYHAHWNVKSYSVTWMVAGNEWSGKGGQSSVAYGSHIETLPTAPNPKAEPQEGCGDKFMGWTDATDGAYVHGTSNLYTIASEFPEAGDAGQIFYAVFADYAE